MGRRRCLACHTLIDSGSYCFEHSPRRILGSSQWKRTSSAIIEAHVRAYGWTCPGYLRPAHPSRDLTADHAQPRARRPDLALDPTNLGGVLCRSCNSKKSAS